VKHSVNPIPPGQWFKSSYSGTNGSCVETALTATVVGARDSKLSVSPVLHFPPAAFTAFVTGLKPSA